jgi:hypothetical protein
VLFTLLFGGAILNHFGKARIERAFDRAHPGFVLRIGSLDYSVFANRLIAQSVTLSATNSSFKAGRVSLTGVRWARLLRGAAALADVLDKASVDATNLDVEFPQARYGIHCTRLQASVPDSELIAEGTELRTLPGDEAFFGANKFRTTRFHLVAPECRVSGLAYGELLHGKSWQAESVRFSRPVFEARVNRDKPLEPFVQSPLMVHEALATIPQPLRIDRLIVTNGSLRYCERMSAGAADGVLVFTRVNIDIKDIANRGKATDAISLQAQGDLMDAGTMKVRMTIPIMPPDFSFHYSGSLSTMDLPRLNAFLDLAEHTRIKSGTVQETTFEIDVAAGKARGHVRAIYKDLVIAFLDKETGSENGLGNRIASLLANVLTVRNANAPDASDSMKEGKVDCTRKPEEEFLQFAWYALRSGVLDVISH